MRILLDENVDRRLRRLFDARYDVMTVPERGWSGRENGDLLRSAAQEFDVLITMDRNIQHQQNLAAFDLGLLLIKTRSNRRQDVEPIMPEINRVLRQIGPGELRVVEG